MSRKCCRAVGDLIDSRGDPPKAGRLQTSPSRTCGKGVPERRLCLLLAWTVRTRPLLAASTSGPSRDPGLRTLEIS